MVTTSLFSLFIQRNPNSPFSKRTGADFIPAVTSLSRLHPARTSRPSYACLGQYLGWGFLIALFITCCLCVSFNIILMLSKSYVASYIISGWKVSLENFHLGPAPAWLDNPPGDFHHVVGQYARFALTLSIRNNPSWSAIKVNAVHMYLGGSTIGINMRTNGNFAGDDVITLNLTVPFTELNELKYPCLYHYSKNMKKVPLTAVLVFVPTILGQDLGTFEMGTNSQLISISSTNILSTFIDEPVAKRCDVDLSEDSALLEGGLKTDLVEVRSLVYNLPY